MGPDRKQWEGRVECLVESGNLLGEGPIWDHREDTLYWVDIERRELWSFTPGLDAVGRFELEHKPSALALHAAGGLLVATSGGLMRWSAATARAQPIHPGPVELPSGRFNDGAVDSQGRFWVGTMVREGENRLYRFDGDELVEMEGNLGLPNGMDWSPDDTLFYFTDTRRRTIYVYDFEASSGSISRRRIFASLPSDVSPDGLVVDAEGFVWTALYHGSRLLRLSPEGNVVSEVRLPARNPSSMAFGGRDEELLFVTTAAQGVDEPGLDGNLFSLRPGVKGRRAFLFGR